jgi:small-conductance mechanosensitive channel
LEKCFAVLVWAGFALYVADLWPDLLQYLEESVIPIGKHQVAVLVILQAAASVAVTLMLALWASAALETRLMRVGSMHPSLRAVMSRAGRATLILVAILLSLSMVGIDLTVLSVFGGALGVGLGLGLQKIASNYVSGFIILLDRSLAIGDMINVDKYYGKVTQINSRYTVVQGLDGIETVVPNEMLVSSPVQNYSLTSRSVLMTSIVIVSFETDVSHALALLQDASQEVARILQDPPPSLYLSRFAENGLELQIGFWIGDPENGRLSVLSDLNRAIWRRFQEHKIHVPKPQREIRLIDDRLEAR